MRVLNFFLSGLVLVALVGCAGYHFGPVNGAGAGEKTVEVLPFNNQTLQPRLGDAVTQSLRERLQADTTYRLATRGPGDIIVTGVIRSYGREGLGFLSTDAATPENFRVGAVAHVTARVRASGKLLFDKEIKGHTLVHVGADLASGERQALPLLADDLAQTIAGLLTEGTW